ncbi:MAG: hypothetical protein K2P70_02755 [Hyphomonadaceae bacterium]|nr:hypothetical protein [Hyphomonadaceae bacterium]
MRAILLTLLIAPCLLASGCTLGNFTSVYRTPQLSDGRSLVLDAEQFVVLQIPQPNDGRVHTRATEHIVCAMPSPDALTAAAARGGLQLDNPQGASGRIDAAAMESAASIALRTQSIQLMRDAMYRMCEAYAAGGMDALEYGIMMRRFQSRMVAILAVEQLTGAVAADQPRITSTTPTAPDHQRQSSNGGGDTANDTTTTTTTTTSTPGETGKALAPRAQPKADGDDNAAAQDEGSEGAASPENGTRPLHERGDPSAIAIAQTVEAITLAAMSTDYSSEICLDAVRYHDVEAQERIDLDRALREAGEAVPPREPAPRQFVDYCLRLIEAELRARDDAQRVLIGAAQRIAAQSGSLTPDDVNSIRRLLGQVDPAWQSADMRWLPYPYPAQPGQDRDQDRSQQQREPQQQTQPRQQGGEGGRELQPMN